MHIVGKRKSSSALVQKSLESLGPSDSQLMIKGSEWWFLDQDLENRWIWNGTCEPIGQPKR